MTREFMMFIYLLLFIYMAGMCVLITWLYKSKKPFVIKGIYGAFVLLYIGTFLYLMPQEIRVDIKPLFLYGMIVLMIIGMLASIFPVIGGIRAVWRWYFLYRKGIILKSDSDVEKYVKATFEDQIIKKIRFGKVGECFSWQVSLYNEEFKSTNTILLSIKALQKTAEDFKEVCDGIYKINGYKVKLEELKLHPVEINAPSQK